jgi:hypothetical protein
MEGLETFRPLATLGNCVIAFVTFAGKTGNATKKWMQRFDNQAKRLPQTKIKEAQTPKPPEIIDEGGETLEAFKNWTSFFGGLTLAVIRFPLKLFEKSSVKREKVNANPIGFTILVVLSLLFITLKAFDEKSPPQNKPNNSQGHELKNYPDYLQLDSGLANIENYLIDLEKNLDYKIAYQELEQMHREYHSGIPKNNISNFLSTKGYLSPNVDYNESRLEVIKDNLQKILAEVEHFKNSNNRDYNNLIRRLNKLIISIESIKSSYEKLYRDLPYLFVLRFQYDDYLKEQRYLEKRANELQEML